MRHALPDSRGKAPGDLIDELCDNFESGWLSGTPIPIEHIVESVPEELRVDLFRELLAIEGEYRAKLHRPLTAAEARERFCGLGSWAEPAIQDLFTETGSCDIVAPRPLSAVACSPRYFVGKYELVAKLGSGAYGTVYKARHPELRRDCAVKVLSPPINPTPEEALHFRRIVARFRRERVALAQLKHPNIIQANDGGEANKALFLVMEFVEGADLGKVTKSVSRLTAPDACEVVRQAAVGLSYIDLHEMIHRDIKPSNLLLGRDGIVRILDLGLARIKDRVPGDRPTVTGALMGTPDFIAPEQARGSLDIDIRADVYSLGCTLYSLLSGAPPFVGPEFDNVYKKFKAHNEAPVKPLSPLCPNLPPGLEELVLRMLRKDPVERPQSPAEVAQEIAPFCAGHDLPRLVPLLPPELLDPPTLTVGEHLPGVATVLTPVADASTLTEGEPRPRRRRRFAWVLSAVAVAAVAGVAIWYESRESKPDPPPPPTNNSLKPHQFRTGEWTDLLDREPTVLAWPELPDREWSFDREKSELRVSHRDRAMFQVGTLPETGSGFELEMTVAQIPWAGGFGIFWKGRTGQVGQEGTVVADYLMINAFTPDLKPKEARLTRGLVTAVPRVKATSTDRLNSQLIARPHLEVIRLAISVTNEGLAQIRFDGVPIANQLISPASRYPKRPGTAGTVGVLVQGSTTYFRSVRVRLHNPGEIP